MEASSMSLKMPFIVCLIIFPIVIMVTLMYQNASFGLFEGFSKGMAYKNVTTSDIGLGQNVTYDNFGEKKESDANLKSSKNISPTNSTNVSTSTPPKETIEDKEKLLDGLLVSGFDESSCISRSQSHLYHKSSPHKPSPYLISKIRKYEELHRRCGPNTIAYNEDMKIIANSNNATNVGTTTCKYVIWVPANGLGNQIISMVSTFLYAILTDRIMLVKFGKDKDGLFCEPFLNSSWLLPKDSPFWNVENVPTYQSMLEKEWSNSSNEDIPSSMFVDLRYSPNFEERFFHCDDSQYFLSEIPLLFFESGQYFVPSFFMTPIFNKELNKMFPEITPVFHHLGRYLFHPSNEAWGHITRFYQQHFEKANERIGLQIRVFDPNSTPHEIVMEQLLNCTLENKILPNVFSMKNSSLSSSDKKGTIKKVVLVASLYPQYGEALKTMYINKSTIKGEVIEIFQPSGEEQQKFNDNKHNMKAWVDMYLLSLTDVLVTTYQSTFGYVAKALGNTRPWILYHPITHNNNKEICDREFNLEPCYHYPPYHYCDVDGKVIENFAPSFPYVRHCKDYPYGIKLTNGSI
ncbi:probable fucosyltransferase 8 [Cicer arietinum]